MTLTGSGPGGTISVPSFSYAFSNSFKPLPAPDANEIYVGDIAIDGVNNLLWRLKRKRKLTSLGT